MTGAVPVRRMCRDAGFDTDTFIGQTVREEGIVKKRKERQETSKNAEIYTRERMRISHAPSKFFASDARKIHIKLDLKNF